MTVTIAVGNTLDRLREMEAGVFQTCVTSPPYYGLRSYLPDGHPDKHLEIGLEPSPDEYVARMVEVFREVRRVLRDDGTAWVNIGDSYAGSRGAQSRGGAPSASSTLCGNGQVGGGPKIKSLSAVQIEAHPKRTRTGSTAHLDGIKPKDIFGIPWMIAFALRADGWFLRSAIVWAKPNPMPESVRDRPTSAYEMVFLLSKRAQYFYDAEAVAEESIHAGRVVEYDGTQKNSAAAADPMMRTRIAKTTEFGATRNLRNVWTIATQPYSGAHFATMPPDLAERCIKAGSRAGDHVLDPFGGAGTTGLVADRLGRHATLCELNPAYADLARERITADAPLLIAGPSLVEATSP